MKFKCPCKGEVIRIEDFPDEIIADKAMGDGFGVNLSGDKIVAPFNGEVKVLYPTGHALCLESEDGIQIMIHIGVDSFKIKGLNKPEVSVGDKVKTGDTLITTNVAKLKKLTGNCATAVVFLSGEIVELLKINETIEYLDENFIDIRKSND